LIKHVGLTEREVDMTLRQCTPFILVMLFLTFVAGIPAWLYGSHVTAIVYMALMLATTLVCPAILLWPEKRAQSNPPPEQTEIAVSDEMQAAMSSMAQAFSVGKISLSANRQAIEPYAMPASPQPQYEALEYAPPDWRKS
jgi:hypothetical protein